jgi:hypothetical protein
MAAVSAFPPEASGEREVVLEAVRADGEALQHASPELRNDLEVVLAAVIQSAVALQWASDELRGSSEVFTAAVTERAGDGPVGAYLRRAAAMEYTGADFAVVALQAMAPKVSPDGVLRARWDAPNVLAIESAETGELIHAMEIPLEHASAVVGFEYAEDTLSVVLGLGSDREGEYVVVDLEKLSAVLHRPTVSAEGAEAGGAGARSGRASAGMAAPAKAVLPAGELDASPFCFNFAVEAKE